MNTKKSIICASIIVSLSSVPQSAQADIIDFEWTGVYTMLDSSGAPLTNTSYPYYGDVTWGYGLRTQIHGSLQFDTQSGLGTATISPFEFFNGGPRVFHDITIRAFGDGYGNAGTLVAGRILEDSKGNQNINTGIIWDADGLFNAISAGVHVGDVIAGGVIPASNGLVSNYFGPLPIGSAVMATTTYNTQFHNGGAFISGNDTVGGSPMDNGPLVGYSNNFDITYMSVVNISSVPIPAAVWLFGSGLLGLLGAMRRQSIMCKCDS